MAQSAEAQTVGNMSRRMALSLYRRTDREQAESGLQFLGLIIFENKLKPGTTPAIQTLRAAHFACRMITGDNPLTAVSVARECGLINPAAQVFSPAFIRGNAASPLSRLEWSSMDEPGWKLDDYSLKPLLPPAYRLIEAEELESHDYTLAVTGDVFRWVINNAPLETMQRVRALLAPALSVSDPVMTDACEDADLCTHVAR